MKIALPLMLAWLPMAATAQTTPLAPPPRAAVLAVVTREATAEVARLKTLDAHPDLPRDNVTGLTTNWVSGTFLVGAVRLAEAGDAPARDAQDVRDYVVRTAAKFNYALAGAEAPINLINANNLTLGEVYERLYQRTGQPGMLMPLQQRLDYTLPYLTQGPAPKRLVWWWCDALFMAPAVYARMSALTGDAKYLQAMDVAWWRTYERLWDADAHLYARDERFITMRDANGKKIIWSRGEGWVIAGLARVLEVMPADFPSRPRYVKLYQDMAARLIQLQGEDGLWRSSLLDPDAFPEAETSGTALETYGLAFGINHGLLKRQTYLPHVLKAWAGLNRYVLPDGLLGQVQTTGDQPVPTRPEYTGMYASGPFIMAGLEIADLGDGPAPLPVAVTVHHAEPMMAPPTKAAPDANASAFEQSEAQRKLQERAATKALAYDPVTDDPNYRSPYPALDRYDVK